MLPDHNHDLLSHDPLNPACERRAAGAGISRRAVMQGGGLASLALLAAPLFASSPASAATRPARAGNPATRRPAGKKTKRRKPRPYRLRDANGDYLQPTPYYVQASCELSEDYFLTADVVSGPQDKVVPFRNYENGNVVEAVVLSNGAVTHLHRDPTATSGWVTDTMPFSAHNITDVAVAACPSGVFVSAVTAPLNGQPQTQMFTSLTSATAWSSVTTVVNQQGLNYLRGGVSTDASQPYFYGWTAGVAKDSKGHTYNVWTLETTFCSTNGIGQPQQLAQAKYPTSDETEVLDSILVVDTSVTSGAGNGYLAVLTKNLTNPAPSQQAFYVYRQNGNSFQMSGNSVFGQAGVESLLWMHALPSSTTGKPGALLWQDQDGNVSFVDETGAQVNLANTGNIGDGAVAPWVLGDQYTFTLLDAGLATVVSQIGTGAATSGFTAPIPLLDGVTKIYSDPTDPAQSTLFAVFADGTVNALTKDTTSGWAQAKAHQPNATMQELDSWRVQITVYDTNNVPVNGAQATVQADRLVTAWQPNGNTTLEPGQTVTMTADAGGQITFCIPAEDLDTAVLTVQALDVNGNPSGAPFVVTPHTDVANFLAGQGSLTDAGQLTGQTMLNAQAYDGSTVFPGLAQCADPSQGATNAVAAVNHIAQLGQGYQPQSSTDVQAASFDLTAATPAFQSSTNPNAFSVDLGALNKKRRADIRRLGTPKKGKPQPLASVTSFWDTAQHDADSVFHGIRKGAITVNKMVSSWSADAKKWTVNLIVDIGDGLDNVITYVVDDIKTAVHAIAGFFKKLGADIAKAVEWLAHKVIELLKAAEANAKVIQGFLTTAAGSSTTPGPFMQVIKDLDGKADALFGTLKDDANQGIALIETAVEDATFGSAAPLPPPTSDTGSNDADLDLKVVGDFGKFLSHCSHNWLLDKIKSYLPHNDSGPSTVPSFTPVANQLATDFKDVLTEADNIVDLLWTSCKDLTAKSISQQEMTDWFGLLEKTVDDGITVLQAITDTVFDLMELAVEWMGDTLNYEFPILPGILNYTLLGQIFKLAGIDPTLSVSHLISLVAAYPATLIHDLHGSGPLFPTTSTVGGKKAKHGKHGKVGDDAPDGWQVGLGITAACVQGVWGFNDIIVDLQTANDDGTKQEAPSFCAWVDIFAPLVLCILQWPSAPNADGSVGPPFNGFIQTDKKIDWLLGWVIASGIFPALFALVQKRAEAVAAKNEPSPKGADDPLADYYGPIVQMICGIVNTITGTVFNVKDKSGGAAIAGGVLANVSYIGAVAAQRWANVDSSYGAVLIKTMADAAGNIGAAICIAEATSIPPR